MEISIIIKFQQNLDFFHICSKHGGIAVISKRWWTLNFCFKNKPVFEKSEWCCPFTYTSIVRWTFLVISFGLISQPSKHRFFRQKSLLYKSNILLYKSNLQIINRIIMIACLFVYINPFVIEKLHSLINFASMDHSFR